MSTIDTQNGKRIRDPMRIRGTLLGAKSTALTMAVTGAKLSDGDTLGKDHLAWSMMPLADFSGGGIPLDGSRVLYGAAEQSEEAGKYGVRGHTEEGFTMKVTAAADVGALTVLLADGSASGTLAAGGETVAFEAGETVMVSCGKSVTLTFTPDSGSTGRILVRSICAGVQMALTEENITACTVTLRSDLSLDNPTWKESEIEYQVYWPSDIEELLSTLSDNTPLTYSAGYEGDMSPQRKFYLSEKIAQADKIVTIKGVDASHRLEKDMAAELRTLYSATAASYVYDLLRDVVAGAGISARREALPKAVTKTGTRSLLYLEKQPRRDVVPFLMNLLRGSASTNLGKSAGADFRPEFIDAGIPVVRWKRPAVKWEIREVECGSVVDEYDRAVNKLTITAPNTSIEEAEKKKLTKPKLPKRATKKQRAAYRKKLAEYNRKKKWNGYFEIASRKISKGKTYKTTFREAYTHVKVSDSALAKITEVNIMWVRYKALKSGTLTLYGHKITADEDPDQIKMTMARPGAAVEIKYEFNDKTFLDQGALRETAFGRSSHTGSFRWKGDPRMQPRDRFTFVRKDGTKQNCTIEGITLAHAGGGTYADITYREEDP
jgi:hypothetical protein